MLAFLLLAQVASVTPPAPASTPAPGASPKQPGREAGTRAWRASTKILLPRCAAAIALEELQQLRVRGQDEPRLLVEAAAQGLHRLHKLVEVGVPAVGPRVYGGGLRVRDPLDLLGALVASGRSPEDIALFLAADLGGAPLALGAAPLGDALALRDHPLENLRLHALHVVDALEPHVHQLDPELGRDLGGLVENDLRDPAAAGAHLCHGLGRSDPLEVLRHLKRPVRRANDLDQVEGGDGVPRLAVHDVVEAALPAPLVAHGLVEPQRVGDAPAGVRVDPDVLLVPGRDLVRVSVILEPALVEPVHFLDERHLEMQAGVLHDAADRLPELGEDHLLGLGKRVDRREEEGDRRDRPYDDAGPLHGFTSFRSPSSWRSGRMPRALSSRITFRPTFGRIALRVSR